MKENTHIKVDLRYDLTVPPVSIYEKKYGISIILYRFLRKVSGIKYRMKGVLKRGMKLIGAVLQENLRYVGV